MEIVHEKEYLHIHRIGSYDNYWFPGSNLFFKDEINHFLDYYNDTEYSFQNGSKGRADAIELIDDTIRANKGESTRNPGLEEVFSYDALKTLKYAGNIVEEYTAYIREQIFEEVRKESFPDYPSRYRCIWVLPDDKECLKYWYDKLVYDSKKYRIFRVNLTGKIHRASEIYLRLKTYSLNEWRMLAFKYWSGLNEGLKEEEEILFEGLVKVLEEIDLDDYMNI